MLKEVQERKEIRPRLRRAAGGGRYITEQGLHTRVYKVRVLDLVPAIKVPAVHHTDSPSGQRPARFRQVQNE